MTTEITPVGGPDFDFMAPLPDLHIRAQRSWEPAARHYIDLTEQEKQEQGVMQNVMHISEVMAEAFKVAPTPENLTAWVDAQPMVGQGLLFCDEVNSEFVKEVPC